VPNHFKQKIEDFIHRRSESFATCIFVPIFAAQKTNKTIKIMEKSVLKCLLIGAMVFVFWLVSLSIMGIVNDRNELSEATQTEIAESWSKRQDFVGPIICVPVIDESKENALPYTCMYVLPERLVMTSDIESEILHRGIFDASVYRTRISGKGTFNLKEMKLKGVMAGSSKPIRYDWSNAQIIAAISDRRGIEEGLKVKIGDKDLELNQFFYNYGNTNLENVFHRSSEPICKVADLTALLNDEAVPFEITAELKGSHELNISPIGQTSVITMQGNCQDPSFNGFMLPSNREVTDNGFKATWKISSLNRNDVDQVFYSGNQQQGFQSIGTKLLIQGGQYTQTNRALKYSFLVLLLSLVSVFVAEMCVKRSINILCYLLIGAALVLFYLMLLSFSEWIGFTMSYFLSALLILGMVYLYLKAIIKENHVAMAACMFMALIDVFIYVLLSIASMSLLVGTLGLFVILGVAMFFSLRFIGEKEK
jgi:inner membrane protein